MREGMVQRCGPDPDNCDLQKKKRKKTVSMVQYVEYGLPHPQLGGMRCYESKTGVAMGWTNYPLKETMRGPDEQYREDASNIEPVESPGACELKEDISRAQKG